MLWCYGEYRRHSLRDFGEKIEAVLTDSSTIWKHPGVSDDRRQALVKEVFGLVRVRGGTLVAVEQPRPEYQPMFACAVDARVRKDRASGLELKVSCLSFRLASECLELRTG